MRSLDILLATVTLLSSAEAFFKRNSGHEIVEQGRTFVNFGRYYCWSRTLKTIKTGSFSHCAAECIKDARCKAIWYHNHRYCRLKKSTCNTKYWSIYSRSSWYDLKEVQPTSAPTTLSPSLSPTRQLPETCDAGCKTLYDGCNTCRCVMGEVQGCTKKYCGPSPQSFICNSFWPTAPPKPAPKPGIATPIQRDLRTVVSGQVSYYPFIFAKTLPHQATILMPSVKDVDKLVDAVDNSKAAYDDAVQAIRQFKYTKRPLEGILAGYAQTGVRGAETSQLVVKNIPSVDSKSHLCQMIEVYHHSLLRDVAFSDYSDSSIASVSLAVSELNKCVDAGAFDGPVDPLTNRISPKTLFRGSGADELIGPYVSQLLLLDFEYGGMKVKQMYNVEEDNVASTTVRGWLNIQHGIATSSKSSSLSQRNWNGRVMGSEVHMDALFQFYYNAAMQFAQFDEFSFDSPFMGITSRNLPSTAWTDGGTPDLFSSIARASLLSLRHAWWNKWQGSMTLRPEVYAARLDQILNAGSQQNIGNAMRSVMSDEFLQILDSNIFDATFQAISRANLDAGGANSVFLNLLYNEGSPTHPSYPAGHAVVAGAATTVLKAYVKTHDSQNRKLKWPKAPVIATASDLMDYTGGDSTKMTIVGEINKLGSNVAIARDFAGVHYRCDSDFGIELGEAFAIKFLQAQLSEYSSPAMEGKFFKLEKYNGELIKISPEEVTVL